MMSFINMFLLMLLSGYVNCSRSMGVCSKIKSTVSKNRLIYFKKKFCCDNYEKHEDGKCLACSVGFTSKAGNDCIPCLHDTFGFRCAENCQCHQKERCDNVHGCVLKHSDNLSTDASVTMINRTHGDFNNYQTATFHMTTDVRPIRPNTELHSEIWTTQQSTKEDKPNGFIGQQLLTYMFMAGTGALLVIIGLCICLVCVCLKRHVSSKRKNPTAPRSAVPLSQFPVIQENVSFSEINSGYGYEVIDDTKLERANTVIQHDYVSVESSNNNSEVCGTDSDGYLHSYHSLISVNSILPKDVDDKHYDNENINEEKPYLELSAEKECKNEVQQNESCELVNNKKEDDIMYDVPESVKSSDDEVIVM